MQVILLPALLNFESNNMKKIFTDQMNREVEIPFPPQRIVSLVPSQTELLYELGLADEVAGQTLFCIHPEEMHRTKPRIGGTKRFHFEKIAALKPDLLIGNKEENEQEQTERLMQQYPVWMSDIHHLDDALQMMLQVGELVNRTAEAAALVQKISADFNSLPLPSHTIRTAYLIWKDPWMGAGHDTFINDMLARCGFENVLVNETSRYPEVSDKQLVAANPELVLLSSEPYPFKEKHIAELQTLLPKARIVLVDGEMFSWYGSRLKLSVAYFKELLLQLQ